MTTERARALRRNATEPERRLWAILYSLRQEGYHFRRQHPIGPYYADFACVGAGLVIEADGVTHTEAADIAYDQRRDDHIRSQGFQILRFWNNDVMANPDGVYQLIADALRGLTPTPDPSQSGGGGRPRTRKLRTGLKDLAARTGDKRSKASVRSPSPIGGGDRGGGPRPPDNKNYRASMSISATPVRRLSERRPSRPPPNTEPSPMRKLTAGYFHSVDGVVEVPDQWQFDAFDDELGALFGKFLAATDTVLLGRKGYEEWAQYWPNAEADQDFAVWINSRPKYVASRTLRQDQLTWQNSTLIEGQLEDFVRDLKARDGGEIAVMGGFSLTRQLLFAGLLDSLSLITHPVIAGSGKRHLFEPGDPVTRLELQECTRTSRGNVVTTYGLKVG